MNVWMGPDDIPWFTRTDDDQHPRCGRSMSGLVYTVDPDPDIERCAEYDYCRDVYCLMPAGHDTPHLPVTSAFLRELGPIVVTSMRREAT